MNSDYYKRRGYDEFRSGPWSRLVNQSGFEESVGGSSNSSMENCREQPKHTNCISDRSVSKGDTTLFDIFHGDPKSSSNCQNPEQLQAAFTLQSAPQMSGGHLELGFGQPAVECNKYPYGDQSYGMLYAFGPQTVGRVMLPLNSGTDDGPIFVNAKQYRGIIRRRRSRAKIEMRKKVTKSRKPYLHLSRHLHAKRRLRGCGGRFLNTKELEKLKTKTSDSKPTGSQGSDSGLEVSSMLSMGDLNRFPFENLSVASFSEIMLSGNAIRGFGIQNNWVATGGIRCNLTI